MDSQQMSIHALLKDELIYEVSIRSLTPKSTVVELRKQLQKSLESTPAEAVLETDLTPEDELKVVRTKVDDLVSEIDRYERSKDRHALYRAKTLGWHLKHRIVRILTKEPKVDSEKSKLEMKVTELLTQLLSRPPETSTLDETKHIECSGDKSVLKWNIKFNGSSDPRTFIERVLEMQQATGITDDKLFKSSALLFIDLGKIWYNGVKDTVTSWDELRELLLEEFLPQDYDYQLMNEIRNRVQGNDEPSHIYFALMAYLFSRLKRPLPESDQLDILRHNIRRDFIKQLALVDVYTVAGLKEHCRKIENACQQKPLFSDFSLKQKPRQIAVVQQSGAPRGKATTQESRKCFKCGLTGHDFKACKGRPNDNQKNNAYQRNRNNFGNNARSTGQPIRCFGCGEVGYTLRSCVKCNNTSNQKKLVKEDRNAVSHPSNTNSKDKFFNYGSIASILFKPSKDDIRPHVLISVDNLEVCAMLDSGATVSILGNNSHLHFARFGFEFHKTFESTCSVANGVTVESQGIMFVPVSLKGVTRVIKFYIIPSIVTDVLLGCDFIREFNVFPGLFDNIDYRCSPSSFLTTCATDNETTVKDYARLSQEQKELADSMIEDFKNISSQVKGLGRTSLIEHDIDTGDSPPIKVRQYPLSPEKKEALYKELDKMLELGVVEPCESPWNNPVLLVKKPNGDWRFCLDSRKLNEVTKGDSYAIPYIPQILDSLKDAKYLSTIDLSSSFWQIGLKKEAQEKTCFTVPGRGCYKWVVMPFGLSGAPSRQQRLMDKLLGHGFCSDVEGGLVYCYVDDIVIVSSSFEKHLLLLKRVLNKLTQANLTINFEKCKFFRSSLKYLGYVVDEFGLRTDPDKVSAILNFPTPANVTQVKSFVGICSWYRRFIRNFSQIIAPMTQLTKKGQEFKWSEECEQAFSTLKNALVTAPILATPDFSKPFTVHCDASSFGLGGMLSQKLNGHDHPIAFVSRTLNKAERNYSATEREALAVLFAVEKFEPYLGQRRFKVVTDHASLKWFTNLQNPTGRLARWFCRLSQFNFDIEHRKGSDNVVPDALSRLLKVEAINSSKATPDEWFDRLWNGVKAKPKNFPNFCIQNDRLFRLSKNKYGLVSEFDWKEVIRSDRRESILRENHVSPTAAHMGVFKTHRRICLRYFWPGMYKDIVEFVKKCDSCSAYKSSQKTTPGLMGKPKVCYRPFQVVSIDLVGNMPRSRSGYTYLLVVTCCFSKYSLLFPLRRATSALVAKSFEKGVILTHGVPETVIADNGVQFTGSEFKNLLKRYQIPNLHFTPRYTPQVNLVERYNKTIMTAIASYVEDDHRNWDNHLQQIQFAINSAVNESTGFTPFFLVHGREPVINGNFYKDPEKEYEVGMPREEYAGELGTLKNVFNTVREKLLQAHAQNATHYNLRRRDARFTVGDIVWKRTHILSDAEKFKMSKLAPKYEKCRVAKVLSPLVYDLIRLSDNKPIGSWHIKDFK